MEGNLIALIITDSRTPRRRWILKARTVRGDIKFQATADNNCQWFMPPACTHASMHVWIMYKHYSTFILDFGICFKDRFDLTKGEAGALRGDITGVVRSQPIQVLLGWGRIPQVKENKHAFDEKAAACSETGEWRQNSALFIDPADCQTPFLMHFEWKLLLEQARGSWNIEVLCPMPLGSESRAAFIT